MQDMFSKIHAELPLLEHLDFVFVEYSGKMDFFQACQVLYIYAKCGYTNSVFVNKFFELYLKMLGEDEFLEASIMNPKILLKLLFSLSKSSQFENERVLWRVIELQILKNGVIGKINLEELTTLISMWSLKKFGSQQFWSTATIQYLTLLESLDN
jgi:hypothetical protein